MAQCCRFITRIPQEVSAGEYWVQMRSQDATQQMIPSEQLALQVESAVKCDSDLLQSIFDELQLPPVEPAQPMVQFGGVDASEQSMQFGALCAADDAQLQYRSVGLEGAAPVVSKLGRRLSKQEVIQELGMSGADPVVRSSEQSDIPVDLIIQLCRTDTLESMLMQHELDASTGTGVLADTLPAIPGRSCGTPSGEPDAELYDLVLQHCKAQASDQQGTEELQISQLLNRKDFSSQQLLFTGSTGKSAAQLALWNGEASITQLLLEHGATLDHEPQAVHMAVLLNQHVAQLVVMRDPLKASTSHNPEMLTAVQLCAERGKHESLKMLLQRYQQAHATWNPTTDSPVKYRAVGQLVSDPVTTREGGTALHMASTAAVSAAQCVQTLLSFNPQAVHCVDNNGQSCIHWAARCASRTVMKQLLDANADPALKDKDQLEALHYAVNSGNKEVISLLRSSKNWDIAAQKLGLKRRRKS